MLKEVTWTRRNLVCQKQGNVDMNIFVHEISAAVGGGGKAIPVTGRGDPYVYETSRLPHFLDNRLTDDGEIVTLKQRSLFTPRKIPGTYFC
jgi:hypothetical protein